MISMLLNRKTPGKIGNIILDATVNESHEYKNDITLYPIETGSNISDHIKNEPERISISGFVTNTPLPRSPFDINAYSTAFLNSPIGRLTKNTAKTRVISTFEELLHIAGFPQPSANSQTNVNSEKILVDIITGLRIYTDMALTSLSIPRDSKTGESIYFTAEFIKISKVKLEIVTIPNPMQKKDIKSQSSNKINAGSKSTSAVSASSRTSIAASLYDKAAKGIGSILK